MRSYRVRELGSPRNMTIDDLPDLAPGRDEVVVDVAAAGVGFVDTLVVSGRYQNIPPVPFAPGMELAGTIRRTGPDVAGWKVGDRVAAYVLNGAFAEQAIARKGEFYAVPDDVPLDQAALLCGAYLTAYFALVERGGFRRGETVLVGGAGGAVGLAAVQIARALGAGRVLGAFRSEADRAPILEAGADAVAVKRSFSLAAAELGCSQSTISQRIARLEKRLNRTLIRRTTRKVELTPDGEAMLIYARSILSISHEVRMCLSQPGLKGILKVGIEDEFARTRMPEVLGIFRQQFPQFGLKFITGRSERLHDALRSRDVDIILSKSLNKPDEAVLWQEQLVWVGHPSLQLGPSDPVPLISFLKPSLTRSLVEDALQANRRNWVTVAECSNLLGILAAARSGIGVAVVGQSFKRSILQKIPEAVALPTLGQVAYVVESMSDHSAAAAFRAVLSEMAKRSTQPGHAHH